MTHRPLAVLVRDTEDAKRIFSFMVSLCSLRSLATERSGREKRMSLTETAENAEKNFE